MFKKIIRGLIKIPATPFVVFVLGGMFLATYIIQFGEWVYEASEFDKRCTKETRDDFASGLKKWFTTV
jgi:hypothetical protein